MAADRMPRTRSRSRRALIDRRPWLLAALAAAIAYYVLRGNAGMGAAWPIALKGMAVGALAFYAWSRWHGRDGVLLTAMLAVAALASMILDVDIDLGGMAFFASNLIGLWLFLRHPRIAPDRVQSVIGIALLLGTPAIAWALTGSAQLAIYALALGGMAAGAWLSAFPRHRVGAGAMLITLADLLIIGRMGGVVPDPMAAVAVWPLSIIGRIMLATGVVQTLRRHAKERAGQ